MKCWTYASLSEILLEHARIFVPLGHNLYPQEDIDLLFENFLKLQPGEFPDVLENGSLFSDEDIFLGIFGYIEHNERFDHAVFLGEFVDIHEDIVGKFLAEGKEYLLADNLANAGLHVLIGVIVLVVEERSGREGFLDGGEEFVESVLVSGRYADRVFPRFGRVLQIALGVDENNRFLYSFQEFADFFFFLATLPGKVDEPDDNIRIVECDCCLSIDDDIEFLLGLVDTGSIEEYDLGILVVVDSPNGLLSGLRLG